MSTPKEIIEEFDKIAYYYEENGWGGGEKVKAVNAEHMGDVSSKLLPNIKSFFISKMISEYEEMLGESDKTTLIEAKLKAWRELLDKEQYK